MVNIGHGKEGYRLVSHDVLFPIVAYELETGDEYILDTENHLRQFVEEFWDILITPWI